MTYDPRLTISDSSPALLLRIYQELSSHYGPQNWWPTRTGGVWEVLLGAILTQHTSWTNVAQAFNRIEAAWGLEGLSRPEVILSVPLDTLTAAVRPAGFHTSKPQRLVTLASFVMEHGGAEALAASGEPTTDLRRELLVLNGIGPETADAILLYALKRPMFIADAYAVRLASRWGLLPPTSSYAPTQALFMDNLPHDSALFNEFHALIVTHAKALCRPRPLCQACPLNRPLSFGPAMTAAWICPKLYTDQKERI
jgi:endonuclease-3 related protein